MVDTPEEICAGDTLIVREVVDCPPLGKRLSIVTERAVKEEAKKIF